jgi:hypothetical protein
VGLRHAHRHLAEAEFLHARDVLLGLRQVVDPSAPYNRVAIASICSFSPAPVGVRKSNVFGRSHASTTAFARSIAPLPPSANARLTTTVSAPAPPPVLDQGDLGVGVGGEVVDRHDARQAVGANDLDVGAEVVDPPAERVEVFVLEVVEGHAAVGLGGRTS